MSDAPERIAVWPDFVGHPSMTGQWSANTHPDNAVAYVRADRLEAQEALLREVMEALKQIVSQIDQGGSEGKVFSRDACITQARATLAKLREHLEGGGTHP